MGLREEISRITGDGNVSPDQHTMMFDVLKQTHPHSIELVQNFDNSDGRGFNCLMYALDIHEQPWAREEATRDWSAINSVTIEKAIQTCKIEEKSYGTIILYRQDNELIHMGRVQVDGNVVSKWGVKGHLWRHRIDEVPSSYGEIFSYITTEDAVQIVQYIRKIHDARNN